jgi:hypothetical protein
MLPMLAMLVAGYMAKRGGAAAGPAPSSPGGGGLGDILGGLFGGQTGSGGSVQPGAQPGLASMLDLDGDGNPLDDILRMVQRGTG